MMLLDEAVEEMFPHSSNGQSAVNPTPGFHDEGASPRVKEGTDKAKGGMGQNARVEVSSAGPGAAALTPQSAEQVVLPRGVNRNPFAATT